MPARMQLHVPIPLAKYPNGHSPHFAVSHRQPRWHRRCTSVSASESEDNDHGDDAMPESMPTNETSMFSEQVRLLYDGCAA